MKFFVVLFLVSTFGSNGMFETRAYANQNGMPPINPNWSHNEEVLSKYIQSLLSTSLQWMSSWPTHPLFRQKHTRPVSDLLDNIRNGARLRLGKTVNGRLLYLDPRTSVLIIDHVRWAPMSHKERALALIEHAWLRAGTRDSSQLKHFSDAFEEDSYSFSFFSPSESETLDGLLSMAHQLELLSFSRSISVRGYSDLKRLFEEADETFRLTEFLLHQEAQPNSVVSTIDLPNVINSTNNAIIVPDVVRPFSAPQLKHPLSTPPFFLRSMRLDIAHVFNQPTFMPGQTILSRPKPEEVTLKWMTSMRYPGFDQIFITVRKHPSGYFVAGFQKPISIEFDAFAYFWLPSSCYADQSQLRIRCP